MKTTARFQIAALAARLRSASREVQLMPAGQFEARDGRGPWFIDADVARQVIALAANRQTPFVIDYEHQTLKADDSGHPAPAAAWFSDMEWREGDGLYAVNVDWTPRAAAYIEGDEYRYLSPVFSFDEKTGAVQEMFMAGMTNNPAIDGIADLAAARFNLNPDDPTEETTTVDEETLKALGLKKDASEKEIQEAVAALKAKADAANSQAVLSTDTLKALGLDDNPDADTLNTAVVALATTRPQTPASGNPDPEQYVPVAALREVQQEVAALRADHTGREVESLVEAGLADGRLMKSLEGWARDLGKKDVAALRSYLDSVQPIAALTSTQTAGHPIPGSNSKLTSSELAVCKATGMSEAAFIKAKEAQNAS